MLSFIMAIFFILFLPLLYLVATITLRLDKWIEAHPLTKKKRLAKAEAEKKAEAIALAAKREAAEKEAVERYKCGKELVDRCEKEGITLLATEDDKSNLWIIANSMGVQSKEEALALYAEGMNPGEEVLARIKKEKDERRADFDKDDREEVSQRLARTPPDLVGRDKYTKWAFTLKARLDEGIAGYEASEKVMSLYPSTYATPQKSVTREAMKGQLVGGSGLAAAKAIEAQNFNARAAASNASLSASMAKHAFNDSLKADELKRERSRIISYITNISKRLIDTDHTEKYISMLEWKVSKAEVTLGGNLELNIDFMVSKGEPEIMGREAILDGIVDITARLKGKPIASTVYCPPYGPSMESIENDELDKIFLCDKARAGFNDRHVRYLGMITTTEITKADIPNITFEIVPRQLWAIEGSRDGLLYDFSPSRK